MNAKILLIVGAVYAAYRVSKKVDAVNQFSYMINGIPSISYSRSGGVTFSIPMQIGNNTGETFEIKSIYAKVYGDDQYIGDVTAAGFTIAGFAKSGFVLDLSISLTNAALSLISAIVGKKGGFVLSVQGSVVTNLITVPMSISKKLF